MQYPSARLDWEVACVPIRITMKSRSHDRETIAVLRISCKSREKRAAHMRAQELVAPWQEMEFGWNALALLIRSGIWARAWSNPGSIATLLMTNSCSGRRKGDRRAFDEIVVRHGSFALSVASRITPNLRDAEDVVQDAMVKVWHQTGPL